MPSSGPRRGGRRRHRPVHPVRGPHDQFPEGRELMVSAGLATVCSRGGSSDQGPEKLKSLAWARSSAGRHLQEIVEYIRLNAVASPDSRYTEEQHGFTFSKNTPHDHRRGQEVRRKGAAPVAPSSTKSRRSISRPQGARRTRLSRMTVPRNTADGSGAVAYAGAMVEFSKVDSACPWASRSNPWSTTRS